MKSLNEDELKSLMRTDAYSNSYNPEYKKTKNIVRQGFKNLYPNDDRNIHPKKYYVWYTQDDNRVREAHAERQGQVFSWDNPPEGGHPGQDYGCRCLALDYIPPFDKALKIAELEQQISEIQARIDWHNGQIYYYEREIEYINQQILHIKEEIISTAKQGFFDGYDGADEALGVLDDIIGIAINSKIPELAPWFGAIAGAGGTAFAKFQEKLDEINGLMIQKQSIKNNILELNKEIQKLKEEVQSLKNKINELK